MKFPHFPRFVLILWMLSIGGLALAEESPPDVAEQTALQQVNGVWVPESIVFNGQTLPDDLLKKIKVELKDGTYVATIDNEVEQGRFTFDESKSPKEMDVFIEQGARRNRTVLAIYQLDGETSTICYGTIDGQRPMSFDAPQGSQFMLIKYKRVQPAEPPVDE